jgi:hypothetical protein
MSARRSVDRSAPDACVCPQMPRTGPATSATGGLGCAADRDHPARRELEPSSCSGSVAVQAGATRTSKCRCGLNTWRCRRTAQCSSSAAATSTAARVVANDRAPRPLSTRVTSWIQSPSRWALPLSTKLSGWRRSRLSDSTSPPSASSKALAVMAAEILDRGLEILLGGFHRGERVRSVYRPPSRPVRQPGPPA